MQAEAVCKLEPKSESATARMVSQRVASLVAVLLAQDCSRQRAPEQTVSRLMATAFSASAGAEATPHPAAVLPRGLAVLHAQVSLHVQVSLRAQVSLV